MLESSNYYEILGIAADATVMEIKKAYFSSVRKYPPERFPEEFKKIRGAYSVISDPDSRLEYDHSLENDAMGQYYRDADYAYEEGRYDEAMELLEKALKLSPGNRIARNLMGFCFMDKEEYDKATSLYKKLVFEYPENYYYHYNLGEALLGKGANKQALEAFENALRLDRSNIESWIQVSHCNYIQNNYDKARRILEEGISECGDNISMYMKLIQIDITQKDMDKLAKDILRLERFAKKDDEERENVAWSLAEIANHITKDMPDFAAKLLEKAKKLDPDEKKIQDMYKEASKINKLQEVLSRFKKDPAVHFWVKDIITGKILGYNSFREELDLHICL